MNMFWRRRSDPGIRTAMIDLRTIPWLTLTAFVTVTPHVEAFPPWLSALIAMGLVGRLALWRQSRRALPSWSLFLLALVGTGVVLFEYRTIFGREPGVALLGVLMTLKLLELRHARDGWVIVMLGFFLLLTHYFIADAIWVGVWMLLALMITTATLIRLQDPASEQPPQNTLRHAGKLLLLASPVMLVLFVLFPRISGPLWGMPQDRSKASSGLSDELRMGSISELTLSTALAFRVEFFTAPPPRDQMYWRGPVMSDFDGSTWRAGRSAPTEKSPINPVGAQIDYAITLEPHRQRWLLALDLPTRLPDTAQMNAALSVVLRKAGPVMDRTRFQLSSHVDYVAGLEERPNELKRNLVLPKEGNLRARQLATQWREQAPAQRAAEYISAKALQRFRDNGFIYTLRPPLLGESAIDAFLFETQRGFCEHYASAYVFLMRAANIPARVIGGYQGGEMNPLDGVLTVRQSDAHAWAEIWTPERGWTRVDPTGWIAPERVEQGLQAALPPGETVSPLLSVDIDWIRALRFRWDMVNNLWNLWVIGYNEDRQRELLRRLGLDNNWSTQIWLLVGLG